MIKSWKLFSLDLSLYELTVLFFYFCICLNIFHLQEFLWFSILLNKRLKIHNFKWELPWVVYTALYNQLLQVVWAEKRARIVSLKENQGAFSRRRESKPNKKKKHNTWSLLFPCNFLSSILNNVSSQTEPLAISWIEHTLLSL